jgi:glycosyltransferase involved in cell wall biosynthesis
VSAPAITVVTPSFNQGRFIRRTIESVLSQSVSGLEYLVFDAVSTDETAAVLREYAGRLTATIERDAGQADAVNKGLLAAKGDIIGWLNSDDVYYPAALPQVLEIFAANPWLDVIYGDADHIDENDGVIEPYYTEPFDYERFKDVCFLCQPAVFFRRSVVERYGLLDARLRYCMDFEYWLRILADKPPFFLKRRLAGSRLYEQNKTLGSREAVHREILEMLTQKFGEPPIRWVYNYGHAVLAERGLTRDTPDADRVFVGAVVELCETAFVQYFGRIPASERQTLADWRAYAGRR